MSSVILTMHARQKETQAPKIFATSFSSWETLYQFLGEAIQKTIQANTDYEFTDATIQFNSDDEE